ncbi:MAG: site-2 protease family protein, partial [Clostridia bacterium]|nr:site-2 protease family protein [Clostridia bacterium]
ILLFLQYFISISISLAVFNLIPIPPLDGSKILMSFLPDRANFWIMNNQRYMMPLLLVLLYLDVLDKPISIVSSLLEWGIGFVTELPFMLLSLILGG